MRAGVCGRAGDGLAVLAGAGRALVGRALVFRTGLTGPGKASEQKLLAGFPDRPDRDRVRPVRTTRSEPESKKCSLVFRTGLTGTSQAGPDKQVRPD
ncbi:hypothetical protein TIFTF001_048618, partial [Ficus carica]